jgi:hypothetical protein
LKVPDRRKHRGPHPKDAKLFDREQQPVLSDAVGDLSWLLTRAYNPRSALTLVGNRYRLNKRQRTAVGRASCSDQDQGRRAMNEVSAPSSGRSILVDGYNILTTIEAALSGGILLLCRDGCVRDMASMRGTYHHVEETKPALDLIASYIDRLQPAECVWYLDSPVSNSGRLKQYILERVAGRPTQWQVQLVKDPDRILCRAAEIVISADSQILNCCQRWHNLVSRLTAELAPPVNLLDLTGRPSSAAHY